MHCEFRPVIANGRFFFDTSGSIGCIFLGVYCFWTIPTPFNWYVTIGTISYVLVGWCVFPFRFVFSCFTFVYFSFFSASFRAFFFWFLPRLSYVFWFVSLTFFRVDYHFIFRFRSVRFSSFFAKVFSCKLKSFRFVFCPYLIHFSVRFSLTNSHFDSIIK